MATAFNPFDPDFVRDPYPTYAALRSEAAVARIRIGPRQILAIVVAVVLSSVFAHGITASPAARWYSARVGEPCPEMREHDTVEEMPLRLKT